MAPTSRLVTVQRAGARRAKLGVPEREGVGANRLRPACCYDTVPGGEGVLVGALQSEREEETRDRAERGSVVRGSDQASVAPKRTPSPTAYSDAGRSALLREYGAFAANHFGVVAAGRFDRALLSRVIDV